jgi:predicted GNAT family acetyltransferase
MTLLGLADAPTTLSADESLYGLDLERLVVPRALESREVECRAPHVDEHERLREWRFAYDLEALGSPASDETRARSTMFLNTQLAEGNVWVAMHDGRMVSLSAFNAALPDIVQVGGIYTPPEFRSRGFARAAVAASLLAARDRGASRAVLFTNNPFAVRCYQALGFERVGDYGLVMLR